MVELQEQLNKLDNWCEENGMYMNYKKTEYMIFRKSHDQSAAEDTELIVGGINLNIVEEFKYLGIRLDSHLSFEKQYNYVCGKVSKAIGIVERIKRSINFEMFKLLLNSYVLSNIDFGLSIWAIQSDEKLNHIQRKIDKLILSYFNRNIPHRFINNRNLTLRSESELQNYYEKCNIHTVIERRNFYILLETHKAVHNQSYPVEVKNIFQISENRRSTRLIGSLNVPTHSTQNFKNSYVWRATTIWNEMIQSKTNFHQKFNKFMENISKWVMKHRSEISHHY